MRRLPVLVLLLLLMTSSSWVMFALPVSGTDSGTSAWPMPGHDARNTGLSPHAGPSISAIKWIFDGAKCLSSAPVIGPDGTLYATCEMDGYLYAISPDGTLKWKTFVEAGYESPAIGSDGTIYIGGLNFSAASPEGKIVWSERLGGDTSPIIGPDGTVYGGHVGGLLAINPSGSLKWRFNTFASTGLGASTAAIGPEGTIYFTSANGLFAINPDGTSKWKLDGDFPGSPTIGSDGTVYVGSSDHDLYAVNPDGTMKWNFTLGFTGRVSIAIGPDGTIIARHGDIYAINPDGTSKWSLPVPSVEGNASGGCYVYTAPAIGADGVVYVSCGGSLYAIRPDGTKEWNSTLPERDSFFSPSIGSDGTLYAPTGEGKVYAFGEGSQGTTMSSVVSATSTATSDVGVKAGDWIKVDYSISGAPAGTSLPTWLRLDVLKVEGTLITVRVTMHMADGTEQNATVPVDVTGQGGAALPVLNGGIIPANSKAGDSLTLTGLGTVTIAEESTRAYAGVSRTVVSASLAQYGTQLTYYWDKQTGMLVEASAVSGTMNAKAVASETNMWSAGADIIPFGGTVIYLVLAMALVVVLVGAGLLLRRRRAPAKNQP